MDIFCTCFLTSYFCILFAWEIEGKRFICRCHAPLRSSVNCYETESSFKRQKKKSHLRRFASSRTIFSPTSGTTSPRQNKSEVFKHLQQNMQLQTCSHLQLSFIINVKTHAKLGGMNLASVYSCKQKISTEWLILLQIAVLLTDLNETTAHTYVRYPAADGNPVQQHKWIQDTKLFIAHVRRLKLDSVI